MKKSIVCAISSALASIFTFGICVCACAAEREVPFTPRENAEITIFTTNDMHGSLIDDGEKVIGIVRAAEIKASTPDSVLVDAGDATQGASFASISRGADVISAMNAAGYDLMAAGNHEFDYGADVLGDNADRADFPILAANVKKRRLACSSKFCRDRKSGLQNRFYRLDYRINGHVDKSNVASRNYVRG